MEGGDIMNQIEQRGFFICAGGCAFGCLVCAADSAIPVLDSVSIGTARKVAASV